MPKFFRNALIGCVGTLLLSAGFAVPAGAVVIDFNAVPGNNNAILTTPTATQGFTFSSGHYHIIDNPGLCSYGGCVDNGTNYILEEAGTLGLPITMTHSGGSAFSLNSFDGAETFINAAAAATGGFPVATHIDILGNLMGGGIVLAQFALDGLADGLGGVPDFQNFVLPGTFTNLASIVFSGSIVGAGAGGISLDNISVAVPEPGTLALFGIGLAGLGLMRRRRKAA